MAVLFTVTVLSQKSAERKSPEKFVLCLDIDIDRYLAWGSNPGFAFNKPTHYLIDYGDCMGPLPTKSPVSYGLVVPSPELW